jgi:hypothetical protein
MNQPDLFVMDGVLLSRSCPLRGDARQSDTLAARTSTGVSVECGRL